jgi:hypothetical protein
MMKDGGKKSEKFSFGSRKRQSVAKAHMSGPKLNQKQPFCGDMLGANSEVP